MNRLVFSPQSVAASLYILLVNRVLAPTAVELWASVAISCLLGMGLALAWHSQSAVVPAIPGGDA